MDCHWFILMADVIAMVADGMPLICDVADVITTWQML